MNKTISINPDLFRFTNNRKSRKKIPADKQIKIRNPKSETNDPIKGIRKQHLLKFIRDQQERNYNKLLHGDNNLNETKSESIPNATTLNNEFNTNFDDSLKYLKDMTDKTKLLNNTSTNNHNHTFKHHTSQPVISNTSDFDHIIHTGTFENHSNSSISISQPQPKWGCLKNGSLPTYRNWKNITQRKYIPTPEPNNAQPVIPPTSINLNDNKLPDVRQIIRDSSINAIAPKSRYLKQRRTVRNTYNLGKSKIYPTISVLVSNKTLRNRVMDKTQGLKQVKIDDIKRYLVKKGFIRVGTSAPNDILRKMYETTSLMCGEINNYNTDNLLYNYLNDVE
jgi:hypothetical protein